ncbi:MAG TPA: hypothetical protein VKH65_16400, partial [Myxococcales bacterium]|nr:hypothetical protein [Myxococcales bacterium]
MDELVAEDRMWRGSIVGVDLSEPRLGEARLGGADQHALLIGGPVEVDVDARAGRDPEESGHGADVDLRVPGHQGP